MRFSKGPFRGWIEPEIVDLLPPAFYDDPVFFIQEMDGEVIKASTWRWVATLMLPDERTLFFKKDKTKGWLECLKYVIVPTKARKEWLVSSRARQKNLKVPKPFGWIERSQWGVVMESYYLAERIGQGMSAWDERQRLREKSVIARFAERVREIHDAGLYHRDFHAGNFLWQDEDLFLTDLHNATMVKTLSQRRCLWTLAHLFHSLRSVWHEEEQMLFLASYLEGAPSRVPPGEASLLRIHRWMDQLQKRQWRSRTKRCLKESTEFSVHKEAGLRCYRRRDFSLNQMKKALEGHWHLAQENSAALLKKAPESIVSTLQEGHRKIVVKQFRYPCPWDGLKEVLRRSKGLRGWMGGNGLTVREIPSVKTLALEEHWTGLRLKESFLLMEAWEEGQELDRYILNGFGDIEKKRRFIRSAARWISSLYRKRVFHRDMKTCNILVSGENETWEFRLLDLEDVVLDTQLTTKRLFKNLLQLNTSTPRVITRTDRLRFLRECLRVNPVVRDPRDFLRRLVRESRQRGLVYVSPQGVVTEEM